MQNRKLSIVIAAYNEAPRISAVLEVVHKHQLIDEVIVIDDGSKDATYQIASKFNIKLIKNPKNLGKTLSIKKGIDLAKNELIMLLDADLIGLTDKSISQLATPVLNDEVDWSLSVRKNSFLWMKLCKMDWISGERVAPKEMLQDPLIWSRPSIGFSLETLMNQSFLNSKKTFRSVYLNDVSITHKIKKVGFLKGVINETKMIHQIFAVMPPHKIASQIIKMIWLNKKYSKQKPL
jgi:glycosyltransferase involved in cell wall biosynthesis